VLHRIARPLFATWFVVEGAGAALRPGEHVAAIREAAARLPGQAGDAVNRVDDHRLGLVVRAHGTAMALAAGALAVGKAPRTAATLLALLTVPTLVRTLPPPRATKPTKEQTRARRGRQVQVLSAVGGALIAAGDTEGRPGLRWRVATARARRAEAQQTA
jgi:hypothetical protein